MKLIVSKLLLARWSAISSHLPGRTDNEIKNFWNTRLKKKLIQMGYDPMTHQPRTDIFSDLSHLIALANLKELFHHQLATLQCLQQQQQLLQPPQASTNTSSMNSTFTNMDTTINLSQEQFPNTISSIGIGGLQLVNDGSFSHMPELKTFTPRCSDEAPLSDHDAVQVTESTIAFCNGESSPDSPWLLSCSSTIPSPSHVAPPVMGTLLTNMTDNCNASSLWPELLVEDPLFNVIA